MALILNIDTATEHASVCLSKDSSVLALEENAEQKNHAAFIQPAIQKIFSVTNIALSSIDSIAVTNGPGSYTGLRVGLSSAKGLCYALNKPLILLNTLEVMANAAINELKKQNADIQNTLFCPMIDARRMEVFTALFDASLELIIPSTAVILDEQTFADYLLKQSIVFSGSGTEKCQKIVKHSNAIFQSMQQNASHMIHISEQTYTRKQFADLAYSEPFYLKEFFTPLKK